MLYNPYFVYLVRNKNGTIVIWQAWYQVVQTRLGGARIEGCFKGVGTNQDTQIGEFHALMTLDSGEVRRAIIPQTIVLPQEIANSYLLATTPFLSPKIDTSATWRNRESGWKLKGGGKQTMSVIRGHHVIHMTPIDAQTPTPHRIDFLHLREPYDLWSSFFSLQLNAYSKHC